MAIKNLDTEPPDGTVLKSMNRFGSFHVWRRYGYYWLADGNEQDCSWDEVLELFESLDQTVCELVERPAIRTRIEP